jgi:hypothetical protein
MGIRSGGCKSYAETEQHKVTQIMTELCHERDSNSQLQFLSGQIHNALENAGQFELSHHLSPKVKIGVVFQKFSKCLYFIVIFCLPRCLVTNYKEMDGEEFRN